MVRFTSSIRKHTHDPNINLVSISLVKLTSLGSRIYFCATLASSITYKFFYNILLFFLPLADTSLKPRILHLNDADVSADTTIVQESGFDDLNGFQVDPSHEVEFNYVNDIFKKSSFYNEILFDEWYSQNIAALQEEDCQHYEAAAASFDFTQMSADQLLLFDWTNEALLDIYKKYSVSKSKFSWFSSSGRPKPVGHRVLKELWSRVSSRLDERPWSSIEVDTILSKDLAKSDHWMNFEREADHMGNKVADFVFDKLLTELVLQLAEF